MNAEKNAERVLVIPSSRFQDAGTFHGFRAFEEDYLLSLLDPRYFSFRPRGEVETDPTFKQLIPYIMLRCRGEIFHYTRGSGGGEKRLQALRSIGIGGHISQDEDESALDPYRAGMLRELREEVEIHSPFTEQCLGFIYDGTSPVGEVHLGIVHLLELQEPLAWPRESAIDDAGFAPLAQLRRHQDEFETWSQFALDELAKR